MKKEFTMPEVYEAPMAVYFEFQPAGGLMDPTVGGTEGSTDSGEIPYPGGNN